MAEFDQQAPIGDMGAASLKFIKAFAVAAPEKFKKAVHTLQAEIKYETAGHALEVLQMNFREAARPADVRDWMETDPELAESALILAEGLADAVLQSHDVDLIKRLDDELHKADYAETDVLELHLPARSQLREFLMLRP